MKLLRKLTIKDMGVGKGEILKLVMSDKEKSHHIATIWGIAGDTKTGESDNGPWVRFIGSFRGVTHDGKKFVAPGVHLPGAAEETVLGALKTSAGSVEFAFDIFAKYDETAATAYVYEAVPLMDNDANDPTERLMRAIQGRTVAQIEGPKEEPKAETETAPKAGKEKVDGKKKGK